MRRSWLVLLVVVLCGAFVANRTMVRAQGPGGGASVESAGGAGAERPEEAKRETVFQIIWRHSGVPGWAIIFMSVVALYLIIRFAHQIRRQNMVPDVLLDQLEDDLENRRVREAIEKCQQNESPLAHIVESGLSEMRGGHDAMTKAAEEIGEAENLRLQQQVGWLAIIGAIAPMLGLTGTVLGMMGAFATIAVSETTPAPKVLASSIQLALVTTAEGLLVAVPVLLAYAAFRNRVTALMLEVGIVGAGLIDRFKHMEITAAMLAGVDEAIAGPAEAGAPPEEPGEQEGEAGAPEQEGEAVPPPPPPPA